MTVFKQLGEGHTTQPIKVYTSQSFEWTSGSSTIDGFSINLARDPTLVYPTYPVGTQDLGGATNGGMYSYPLFKSIKQVFYEGSASVNRSLLTVANQYPSHSMIVWNVGNNYVGDQIRPNSFKVEMTNNSNFIQDDGAGRLRLNHTGDVVGTIFYESGLAIVQYNVTASGELISEDGMTFISGSTITTNFSSTIDIYEHTVSCVISPTEYNNTVNPSAFSPTTSSITYNQYLSSGSVQPYITTIGLYNDQNELLAVGKVSTPITRTQYTDQTFVISFDQ